MQGTADFLLQRHSRHAWSMRSPRARSCRCCCSRCCSALRCTRFGGRGTLVFDFIEKSSHVLFAHRRHHHEGRADRRVRRHGLHHRQVRRRLAVLAGQADGHVLPDLPGLHLRRAGHHRPPARLQHLEVHQVHQGRAAHRAGHLVVRIGAAAHDGKDGEPGREEVGGRAW